LPPINQRKSGVWLSGEVYRYDPDMFLIAVMVMNACVMVDGINQNECVGVYQELKEGN